MVLLSYQSLLLLASCIVGLVSTSPLTDRHDIPNKQWTFLEIPPSHGLKWYPCLKNFTCAMLNVPLDYTNHALGRSYIPLIKFSATTTPYKGMVLTNPGGPGDPGVEFLQEIIDTAVHVVGSNYDIVSWDPRGTGQAIPAANCTLPPVLKARSLETRSLEPFIGPHLAPIFFEANYNQSLEIGIACENSIGAKNQAGPHVTTATVVRDMVSILEAYVDTDAGKTCKDGSLLNYWGFSYGTFIGQTFASMFPDRIGKVVLDGVLNPDDWVQGTGQNLITFTDDVFSTFFIYCSAAGPTVCPYSDGTTTAHELYQRFKTMVARFDPVYAYSQGWSNDTAIEILLTAMKELIFEEIYQPMTGFPAIGQALVAVEAIAPDVTLASLQQLENELGINLTAPITVASLWERAILCTDSGGIEYGISLAETLSTQLKEAENLSWVAGEFIVTNKIACAGWPITSDYRFLGPFKAKTKNPILFVSNTLDIITPHQNGVNSTTRFTDSQLLTIEGIGHTSIAPQNKCAYTKIGTFFQTGQLPGKNNYCALEVGPFGVQLNGSLISMSDKRDIGMRA